MPFGEGKQCSETWVNQQYESGSRDNKKDHAEHTCVRSIELAVHGNSHGCFCGAEQYVFN